MFNKIWAGLILVSLLFALYYDGRDLAADPYRNDTPLPVTVVAADGWDGTAARQPVTVRLDSAAVARHFGTGIAVDPDGYEGTLLRATDGGVQVRFAKDADLPEPLATIRRVTSSRDNDLRGTLMLTSAPAAPAPAGPVPATTMPIDPGMSPVPAAPPVATADADSAAAVRAATERTATVTFAPVRFVKMQAITKAAFDFADTAVTVALGLIGVLALWLGLLRIAERSGLIQSLVRVTGPLIRPLFPGIPKDHPALGLIILNMTANMLGLGNAATPLGIKAMESMQTLNDTPDEATDDQVMFLAINTASVQLVPPVLLIAILGLEVNRLIFPILIVTAISLVVAIVAAKAFGRMRRFRRQGPLNTPDAPPPGDPLAPASLAPAPDAA